MLKTKSRAADIPPAQFRFPKIGAAVRVVLFMAIIIALLLIAVMVAPEAIDLKDATLQD